MQIEKILTCIVNFEVVGNLLRRFFCRLYGSNVCGEGGEYETLTLDCPLFKVRLPLLISPFRVDFISLSMFCLLLFKHY